MLTGYDVVSHSVIHWYTGQAEHIIYKKYNFMEVRLIYLSMQIFMNQSFSRDNC